MIWLLVAMGWFWISAPSMGWLDATELSLSANSLGIGHPPGQIPHVLLGALVQLLPVGDPSFRLVFLSVLGCLLCLVFAKKLSSTAPNLWIDGLIILLGTSWLFSLQAIRTEVYGLVGALSLGSVLLTLPPLDVRKRYLAWFVWGLAMLLHPTISFGALPFLLRGSGKKGVFFTLLVSLLLVYLPFRAMSDPAWNFGNPKEWDRFLWYITGKLYSAYSPASMGQYVSNVFRTFHMLAEMLTLPGVALSIYGGFVCYRERRSFFFTTFWSLVLFLFPVLSRGHFWETNPDLGGYLLPASALLLAWSLRGGQELLAKFAWLKFPVVSILVLVLSLHLLEWKNDLSLRKDFSAHIHAKYLLEEPGPRARVHVASFSTFSFMRYGQVVEGLRPDLRIRYRGLPTPFKDAPVQSEEQQWWELALSRGRDGQYELRKEDRELAPQLIPQGWFYLIGGGVAEKDWVNELKRRNQKVLGPMRAKLEYPKEPLILNYLVHYIMSRDSQREETLHIWRDFQEMFPSVEGLEMVEPKS